MDTILTIIESINDYPRKYLFIFSKDEPYSEKGLQRMIHDLMNFLTIWRKKMFPLVQRKFWISHDLNSGFSHDRGLAVG